MAAPYNDVVVITSSPKRNVDGNGGGNVNVMNTDCVEMTIQHDAGTESAIIGIDAVLKVKPKVMEQVKSDSAHPTDENETSAGPNL